MEEGRGIVLNDESSRKFSLLFIKMNNSVHRWVGTEYTVNEYCLASMLTRPACVTCEFYIVSCVCLVLSGACMYMYIHVHVYDIVYECMCACLHVCVCVCGMCSSGMEGMQREVAGRLLKYGLELQTPHTYACKTVDLIPNIAQPISQPASFLVTISSKIRNTLVLSIGRLPHIIIISYIHVP